MPSDKRDSTSLLIDLSAYVGNDPIRCAQGARQAKQALRALIAESEVLERRAPEDPRLTGARELAADATHLLAGGDQDKRVFALCSMAIGLLTGDGANLRLQIRTDPKRPGDGIIFAAEFATYFPFLAPGDRPDK